MRIKRNWLLYSGIFLLLMHFYISFSDLLKFAEGISKPILFIGLLLLIISSYIKKNKIVLKTVAYLFAFVNCLPKNRQYEFRNNNVLWR